MKNNVTHKIVAVLIACSALITTSCTDIYQPPIAAEPQVASRTISQDLLANLPVAKENIVVSVYEFQDQTGQMAPNDTFASYSRAVTQGGLAILTKALLDAGDQRWFSVVERGGLKNVLQERQLIKAMRSEYAGPDGQPLGNIMPMLYAGLILEGGIVSYESNIVTGGLGAKYLGVGGDTKYRRDIVTVYLRVINSQTGQVMLSVNSSKTIYSSAVNASVFRFVAFDKLLEIETGFTSNEPPQFAVRQAIEMAVYSMIMEGAIKGMWEFADADAGQAAIGDYIARRDGSAPPVLPRRNFPAPAAPTPAPAPEAEPVAAPAPAAKEMPATKEEAPAPAPAPKMEAAPAAAEKPALLTVRFNKPHVEYQYALAESVAAAEKAKPGVVYDVLSTLPDMSALPPERQALLTERAKKNLREVIGRLQEQGVSADRIRIAEETQKIRSQEVRIFVH